MRPPHLDDGDVRLYVGDCVEVMREMDADSVDAVVCDPPYGLEFMGKEWDRPWAVSAENKTGFTGRGDLTLPAHRDNRNANCRACGGRQRGAKRCECASPRWDRDPADDLRAFAAWCETWAREAHRVLKPGGHLLAFGGTRTFHRLTCGIEDAGFEIRDCLSWLYGSGFPKSLDVSKAIDKAAGAAREVVGTRKRDGGPAGLTAASGWNNGPMAHDDATVSVTAPATDAAREWQGWGTALKPAWEPCVVARKPLTGTVAANVQAHGTGAINIDGCRVAVSDHDPVNKAVWTVRGSAFREGGTGFLHGSTEDGERISTAPPAGGRWPANVALDEDAAAILDAQSGQSTSRIGKPRGTAKKGAFANSEWNAVGTEHNDTGGASRFFYTAKASRADRTGGGVADNTHPTVKPTDLMRWLVRLVTPPGGVVLDPFAGSGSTLVAARAEGVRAIGIEREPEYADIITARLAQLSLFSEGMGE